MPVPLLPAISTGVGLVGSILGSDPIEEQNRLLEQQRNEALSSLEAQRGRAINTARSRGAANLSASNIRGERLARENGLLGTSIGQEQLQQLALGQQGLLDRNINSIEDTFLNARANLLTQFRPQVDQRQNPFGQLLGGGLQSLLGGLQEDPTQALLMQLLQQGQQGQQGQGIQPTGSSGLLGAPANFGNSVRGLG